MDVSLTLGIAILTFIIGIIVKFLTDFDFNKFLAFLGSLVVIIPFIIATINILNNPENPEVINDSINFFTTAFVGSLPGVIIGDVAALFVIGFLNLLGIKT